MTEVADTPEQPAELSMEDALAIANREAFVVSTPLSPAVLHADNDPMVTLRVTRMIGGVAREFSMALGLQRSPAEFCAMARKVWMMLVQEAEASREQKTPKNWERNNP